MREDTRGWSALTRFFEAIEWAGRVLFGRSDHRARGRGWEVLESGRLNRSYRDRRFDRLVPCVWCDGIGCDRCDNTGRIVRPERSPVDSGSPTWAESAGCRAPRRRPRARRGSPRGERR